MKIVLDAFCMERKAEAHAYLKEELGFPDYYGNNLDALHDCLAGLGEAEIVVVNQSRAEGYFPKLYRVIKEAAVENPRLSLREEAGDVEMPCPDPAEGVMEDLCRKG